MNTKDLYIDHSLNNTVDHGADPEVAALRDGPAVRYGGKKGCWREEGTHALRFEGEERLAGGVVLRVAAWMKLGHDGIVIRWTVETAIEPPDWRDLPLDAVVTTIVVMEAGQTRGASMPEIKAAFETASSLSANRCVARIRAALEAQTDP